MHGLDKVIDLAVLRYTRPEAMTLKGLAAGLTIRARLRMLEREDALDAATLEKIRLTIEQGAGYAELREQLLGLQEEGVATWMGPPPEANPHRGSHPSQSGVHDQANHGRCAGAVVSDQAAEASPHTNDVGINDDSGGSLPAR